MVSLIAGWIKSNLPAALAGFVILLLLIYTAALKLEMHFIQQRLEVCASEKTGLLLAKAGLEATLRQQNEAVKALHAASVAKLKRGRAEQLQASRLAAAYRNKAEGIRRLSAAGDECKALTRLLDDFIP